MTIREDLVSWIETELPEIKVPCEETLNALTKGKHEKALWEEVTKRVRREKHARKIRSFLSLTAEKKLYEPSKKDQEELDRVLDEIKQIEKETLFLREQLEEIDDREEGDITTAEVDEAVMDGVLQIVTDQEEELTQLLGLLQRSPWGDGGDSSDSEGEGETDEKQNAVEHAVRKWCKKGAAEWNIAESELQMVLSESWGTRVGSALLSLLHESETSLADIPSTQGSSVRSGSEELVRDAQLRAFSRLRTLEREVRAAEARAKAMKHGVDTSRVLWAQIEAERAVLAFASRPRQMNSGSAAERRARRAVRRGKDVVKELEDCAKELCIGSLAVLQSASKDVADVTRSSMRLERDLPIAADAAEKMLSHVEHELNRGDSENDPRKTLVSVSGSTTEGVESRGIQEARRLELQRRHDESVRTMTGLITRSEILCEQRSRAVEELERTWMPRLREGVQQVELWREEEIVKVTEISQEWSTAPAKEAAPWLLRKT